MTIRCERKMQNRDLGSGMLTLVLCIGFFHDVRKVCNSKNGSDSLNGTLIKVPGVEEIYDYEREASNTPYGVPRK